MNERKRTRNRRAERKLQQGKVFIVKIGKTNNLAFLSSEWLLCFWCIFSTHGLLSFFSPEMAGGVLLALLLCLSASVPCFSVYNSGECFFNTKGTVCVC